MTVPSSILLRPENRQAQTAADMATYATPISAPVR